LNVARLAAPQTSDIYANFCSHVNPANEKNIQYNKNIQVEVLFCLALHIAIFTRIQIFKTLEAKRAQTTSQTQAACSTNIYLQNADKVTLADFVTNFFLVLWIGLLSFIQYKVAYISPRDSKSYPNSFFLFVAIFYTNSVSSLVISLVYFSRHPKLRTKMWKETLQTLKT
jgi:hypothetical protein